MTLARDLGAGRRGCVAAGGARSSQTVQLARLIEEVIGTARQLAEQNAIGSTVNSVQCGNGPYDRASGSIRSTQTRRHFAISREVLCDGSRWKSVA